MTDFDTAYAEVREFTLIDYERCRLLWSLATKAPPGDFVEVGVYKGGSAMLLNRAAPGRKLYLFDTFRGHPDTDTEDAGQWPGRFNDTSLESVASRVTGEFYLGTFPDSLPKDFSPRLALLHIDVDLYSSTKSVCEHLVPLLVPGGVAICDDYGFCPGAKRAIDEYARANPVNLSLPATGQAMLCVT